MLELSLFGMVVGLFLGPTVFSKVSKFVTLVTLDPFIFIELGWFVGLLGEESLYIAFLGTELKLILFYFLQHFFLVWDRFHLRDDPYRRLIGAW